MSSGQGMVWNGTKILVWNMEDARMEWNGRFQEWNGRQSSILPYQISSIVFTEKHIPMSVSDKILSQKYSTLIPAHIICRQIAVLWLCTLRKPCTYCIIVSTLQFKCCIDVTVDDLDRFDLLLLFFLF